MRSVTDALEPSGKPFQFFNGLPTAEVSQQAYRAIGVTLYSSAAFAFAPDISLAFYQALETGNEQLTTALLREFYHPLVRLRDRCARVCGLTGESRVTLEGIPVRPGASPAGRCRSGRCRRAAPDPRGRAGGARRRSWCTDVR